MLSQFTPNFCMINRCACILHTANPCVVILKEVDNFFIVQPIATTSLNASNDWQPVSKLHSTAASNHQHSLKCTVYNTIIHTVSFYTSSAAQQGDPSSLVVHQSWASADVSDHYKQRTTASVFLLRAYQTLAITAKLHPPSAFSIFTR